MSNNQHFLSKNADLVIKFRNFNRVYLY